LSFYNLLGFYPDNIGYYQLALRHSSVAVLAKNCVPISNERLEFLGDAVLSLITADMLYHRFGNKSEGFLTDARSKIVNREVLNKLAFAIGLDKLLMYSKSLITPEKTNIYGNAIEALIGAIYLDRGYETCRQFIEEKLFVKKFDIAKLITTETNFKSRIIEWAQKRHFEIRFDTKVMTSEMYNFETVLFINDREICDGFGKTKKESQQNASKKACRLVIKTPQIVYMKKGQK
jgi:ribonuclease-3